MGSFSSAIGQFVIGESPIEGSLGAPQTLQQIIPAYLYEQYADDPYLQAFVDAFNQLAQGYLDWYNETYLADYTTLSGALLDWVGAGLYGLPRPVLTSGISRKVGPFNTAAFNSLAFNGQKTISSQSIVTTTDDVYKRCLTWNFFKGDGFYFTVPWLKRRIMRFLSGSNGTAPSIDQTYPISVVSLSPTEIILRIDPTDFDPNAFSALQEGIAGGVLGLPFQFQFSVNAGGSGFGFFAFGISSF